MVRTDRLEHVPLLGAPLDVLGHDGNAHEHHGEGGLAVHEQARRAAVRSDLGQRELCCLVHDVHLSDSHARIAIQLGATWAQRDPVPACRGVFRNLNTRRQPDPLPLLPCLSLRSWLHEEPLHGSVSQREGQDTVAGRGLRCAHDGLDRCLDRPIPDLDSRCLVFEFQCRPHILEGQVAPRGDRGRTDHECRLPASVAEPNLCEVIGRLRREAPCVVGHDVQPTIGALGVQ